MKRTHHRVELSLLCKEMINVSASQIPQCRLISSQQQGVWILVGASRVVGLSPTIPASASGFKPSSKVGVTTHSQRRDAMHAPSARHGKMSELTRLLMEHHDIESMTNRQLMHNHPRDAALVTPHTAAFGPPRHDWR
eukprot:369851-Rhodomonas_salina.1